MAPLSFQQIILRLHEFWASRGCLLWQPYSEKVGAGTGNPATILRVLGPEPWNVAYVEPSYRPDDGRYAENPNRMQMHTQYQVILKPAPAASQDLYLDSLAALGIDGRSHDIRFVEDNWESPALGAWGLGWEVWLDGMEITQFTYFQQAGGLPLDPPPVELTYGLERIALYLQGRREVWEIDWDGCRTYGDVLRQAEIEHCVYNFETADVARLRQMYDLYEVEARAALARGLVIPAHDYVLRCSHTFNVLDARGAVSVAERAACFARMRDLARQTAVAYVEQRRQAGFPWLTRPQRTPAPVVTMPAAPAPITRFPQAPATFVLEIGCEELPPADVRDALAQLEALAPRWLAELRLAHGAIHVMGAPRRLAMIVEDLACRQTDEETWIKGPPVARAFDAHGQPTAAARGFARRLGIEVEALQVRDEGGGRYVFANVQRTGREASVVLAEMLPQWLASLKFGKAMRWNESGVAFARPVRWLVSLLGAGVVPFSYAGVTAGRTTRGPRAEGAPPIEIPNADMYRPLLTAHRILLDRAERRAAIAAQAAALAAEVGGHIPDDPALLDEVTDLVEQPFALRGQFSSEFLRLPSEVLTLVMRKHQRYFPIIAAGAGAPALLPYFVAVCDGAREDQDRIREGYERVLQARFADAAYFYQADAAQPLEAFTPRLAMLTFHEKLGSMLDKVERLRRLAPFLAEMIGLPEEERLTVQRAAALCKSDLATQMVIEMTALQGVMGRVYARLAGESEAVADAIFEHYLPRFAGDALPATRAGMLLGVADRLDSLVGLFAIGAAPTASTDPFGLRRETLGLIQTLVGLAQPLDLNAAARAAATLLPLPANEASVAETLTFIRDRLYGWLREQGLPHDVTAAVLAEQGHDPYRATRAAQELAALTASPDWPDVLSAYARCQRLVREAPEVYPLMPELYVEEAERLLYQVLTDDGDDAYGFQRSLDGADPVKALAHALRVLRPAIDRFFANVLVMVDDPTLRRARLALVQRVAALPQGIADLSLLQGF